MPSPRIIKKYENRRLYDTDASRYVNLDDVARMVREGVEVQVIDARTGEDLTRVILTQIIVEDAKGRESGLPLDLLRQLVQASDRATHDFLSWYLRTAFDMYQKSQNAIHTRLLDWRNLFTGQAEIEELRRRIQELEQRLASKQTKAKKNPK